MTSALLTDLYQLTMGYGYWKNGTANNEAVFHLFYRTAPFGGKACITAGTTPAIDFLNDIALTELDLEYLSSLVGNDAAPLFSPEFIGYLRDMEWELDVHAVQEGNLVFPNEPILRIQGPIIQCQLVETALLNIVNFQSLVATKAANIHKAADGDQVLEFGLRRAQGPDGGLSASRAAYIGGCDATSNVLAGQLYGIPVKGTHAHSWVMSFDDELEAFEAYAEAMPNNVVLLVDTYDTITGVHNAIKVAHDLEKKGHKLMGIRLDSGDLTELSKAARLLLDQADLNYVKIIASNDLDEHVITKLKAAGARIDIWGVGTKLVTAYDQPALGGVYKLGAIRDASGTWQPRIKLSNDTIKVSNPGVLQIARRTTDHGNITEDIIFDEELGFSGNLDEYEILLKPALSKGRRVFPVEPLDQIRTRAKRSWEDLNQFALPVVKLDPRVEQIKQDLLTANGFTL